MKFLAFITACFSSLAVAATPDPFTLSDSLDADKKTVTLSVKGQDGVINGVTAAQFDKCEVSTIRKSKTQMEIHTKLIEGTGSRWYNTVTRIRLLDDKVKSGVSIDYEGPDQSHFSNYHRSQQKLQGTKIFKKTGAEHTTVINLDPDATDASRVYFRIRQNDGPGSPYRQVFQILCEGAA